MTTISAAVAVNMALYGLTAPFAAALMERFGIRRVVDVRAAGGRARQRADRLHDRELAADPAVGRAGRAGHRLDGAVAGGHGDRPLVRRPPRAGLRHPHRRRRGRAADLPAAGGLDRLGAGAGGPPSLGHDAAALAVLPLVAWLLRDRPRDLGRRPYGGTAADDVEPVRTGAARNAVRGLVEGREARPFWLLAGGFFICGMSTNGLVQPHFIPAAHDHGMPVTTAAGLLAVVGLFDIAGTIFSGWLTDRVDPRVLLLAYYGLRGLSLFALPTLFGADLQASMVAFIVFYGLDWVATVPPTLALCREHFGARAPGRLRLGLRLAPARARRWRRSAAA